MGRLFLITLTVPLLGGCAQGHATQLSVDSRLQPYWEQFLSDAAATRGAPLAINDLILKFDDGAELSGAGENGLCTFGINATPVAMIGASWWASSTNETQKQALVYHELGHCALGIVAHDPTMILARETTVTGAVAWQQAYRSLMNPYSIVSVGAYGQQLVSHQALIKNLFLGVSPLPTQL
jgi:hypothetical protein